MTIVLPKILLNILALNLMGQLVLSVCTGDGPCRCIYNDGSGIVDISSIGNYSGGPRFPSSPDYNDNIYAYNPCFPMTMDNCKDAAACRKVSGTFVSYGTQESAYWTYSGSYPLIIYTASTGKQTEMMLVCDTNFVNPQLTVIGDFETGYALMTLRTVCACPGSCPRVDPPSSQGLTAGSVMLIIFFVVLVVYIAAGMIYNYAKAGKTGKEIFPNYNSWTTLPGLVLDGFRWTWDSICGRGRKTYESI